MRRATGIGLLALALAAGAAAKAPPSGIQLCGKNGCATIAFEQAERLFTANASSGLAAPPGRFYRLRWSWDDGKTQSGGYWLPDANALRLVDSWAQPDPGATAALTAAAAGLEAFSPEPPTGVAVGRREAADPASYTLLLTAGTRVSTWPGDFEWARVRLFSPEPSPWTDGSYDVEVSTASGYVFREGVAYRIPLAIARLARLGRSLAPTPAPTGFGALGAPGCAPASPRDDAGEVFGTAVATQLWALVPGLTGVAGRRLTIVLRFGGRSLRLSAIGPGGVVLLPDAGPRPLARSSWKRPGIAWSAAFTFPSAGCWRLHAGDGTVAGDLWLDVRS